MIHKYKFKDLNIVMDIESGAVHIVDDCAFELLSILNEDNISSFSSDDAQIMEAYTELLELYNAGLLFSKCDYIDLDNYNLRYSPVKAMCLHVAHDCNLRCTYCFAETGGYGGQVRKLMDVDTGKAAIDFLIEKSKGRKNLEIDYFGGEPLMNFEFIKKITHYALEKGKEHNKNFRFTVTTNGLLLDDSKMEYINKYMSNVVLSIDGRKEVNDSVRKRIDNSGCYDSILPKFQKLAELREQDRYYVRGTFTKQNLDFYKDVIHLADCGFKQISIEPVTAPDTAPYAICEENLTEVFESYDKLTDELIKRKESDNNFNFFHFMVDLEQGPCVIKRLGGCGAGNEYIAVTPSGDIYPCHQFAGNSEFIMGNVHNNTFDEDMKARFSKLNIYTKEECNSCFAKYFCSGGCNANNLSYGGSLSSPYKIGCEMQKKRLECAIGIKAYFSK